MKRFNPAASAASPETPAEDRTVLVVGQRIHCILYGGMDGIIYEIVGEQKPETISKLGGIGVMGGNADFRIVFTGEHAHLATVSESVVRDSVQWSIEDGIADANEIKSALAAAEARKKNLEAEAVRKSNERAARRAELPKQYPFLETIAQQKGNGARTKSSHALGAANLKAELMRAFPGIKFSVKSESYSGGDAIRVHWELGPTTAQVSAISDKYQEGSFDGMTDSYEYNTENVWPDVFGGAKYVTESRNFPPAIYDQIGRALCALQQVEHQGECTRHLMGSSDTRDLFQHVNELLSVTAFPAGAKFKGIEVTPEAERVGNNWCRIVLELPAPPQNKSGPCGIGPGMMTRPQVVETQHTKTKCTLFVVQLGERVDRAEYERINRLARELGGYYSSYRRDGAIPGFIFKVREKADEFILRLGGAPTPAATQLPSPEPAKPLTPPQPAESASIPLAPVVGPLQIPGAQPPPVANLNGGIRVPAWRQRFIRN